MACFVRPLNLCQKKKSQKEQKQTNAIWANKRNLDLANKLKLQENPPDEAKLVDVMTQSDPYNLSVVWSMALREFAFI